MQRFTQQLRHISQHYVPQQLLFNLTSQQQYQCNILNNLNKYLLTKYKAHCIETFSYTMLQQIHMFIHECHAKIVRPMIFDSPKNMQQIYNYLKYYSLTNHAFCYPIANINSKMFFFKTKKQRSALMHCICNNSSWKYWCFI